MLSAFGKVILLGEHAVVHGRPALAVGLPDGLVLESCVARPGPSRVLVVDAGIDQTSASQTSMGAALRAAEDLFGGGFEMVVRANIPFGAGLGSSAALSVLIVRAMAAARGSALLQTDARKRAHDLEECFHGNPSGVDDTVAAYGGLCLFKRDGWDGAPYALESAERVTPQALRLPFEPPPLVIGDSGVPRSTREVVAAVGRRLETVREATEREFDRIGALVWDGVEALRRAEMPGLARAMNENQDILRGLGVSCPKIDAMIDLALGAGALSAKLTGAGGGGCVIALAPGLEERVAGAWRTAGFRAWTAHVPAAGVTG